MRKLIVKNFSCISNAEVDFNKLTVFIGPQASGKSVICKLSYFFIDIAQNQAEIVSPHATVATFKEFVAAKFLEWFPISAWGEKQFQIEFYAGDYWITITRVIYRGKVNSNFRIKFSSEFESNFMTMVGQVSKQETKRKKDRMYDYERTMEMRHIFRAGINKLMGKDYISTQIFIPAGRSFFTSIGKAVAAFEQGRVLDPLIVRFGRLFTAYKAERSGYFYADESTENLKNDLEDQLYKLLGGKLLVVGESELVQCPDGRKIPLSSLSSGQQELLPLVEVLPKMIRRGARQAIYIEEPEAHLFPMSQSKLVEILSGFLHGSVNSEMILTTHSPYVLVKINNLIKAGQLGRSTTINKTNVAEIVPRHAWLGARAVNAYAIVDGVVKNIVDKDGLIDADYLDEISGELSNEFGKLLDLEYPA